MSVPSLPPSDLGLRSAARAGSEPRKRVGLPRRIARALGLGARMTALGVLAAHWALLVIVVSTCVAWSFIRPPATLLMLYRSVSADHKPRAVRYVALKQIPVSVRWMLVNLEDYTFYQHHGIDLEAIKGAVRVNRIIGYPLYGGSTITQQLARSLYLTPHKNYVRKYVEAIIALTLEAVLSKERILELYFNYVEWGPGVYGIGAAAAYHFKKDLRSLTLDEYRRLLTLLSSPVRYSAWNFGTNRLLAERYRFLLTQYPDPQPRVETEAAAR